MDVEFDYQLKLLQATYPASQGTQQGKKPISLRNERKSFIPEKQLAASEQILQNSAELQRAKNTTEGKILVDRYA